MKIKVGDTVLAVNLNGPFKIKRVKLVKVLAVDGFYIEISQFYGSKSIALDLRNNLDYNFIGWLPSTNLVKLLYGLSSE